MRGWRWLLAGLVGLLALAVAGVWLLPPLLDWNRYRGEIAELASERIGRPVRIDGPITLALLPQPMLTAGKVSLGEAGGGEAGGGSITAAELRLRVALGPLLAGRMDARDLVLRGVDIRLPWKPGAAGPGLGKAVLALSAPDWLSRVSARIEGGRLVVGEKVFTDIDATLATSDATGTYMAAGTAKSGGQGWHFTARLSRPGGDGAVGLDLAVDGQGKLAGLGATLTGQVARDGTLAGRVAGRGPDLSQLLPAPAVPFRAEGRVSIAGGLAVADQLTGEIGGAPASGAVALRLDRQPRLDVAVTASRLDLDAWAPALLRAASGGLRGLPVGIDLSAEAAQLAGGTLRRLRGAFDIGDGAVIVREARAVLPGDAMLRLTGRVETGAGGLRLEGAASLWAPALRTTLSWTGGSRDGGLPPLALRSARLSGHVVADAQGVAIDRMTGTLDGGPVAGGVRLLLGPQPQLQASLSLDRLDLDPWLPEALPSPSAVLGRLADMVPGGKAMGLEVQLKASQALLRGVALAPLSLDLGVEAGRLLLHRAVFRVAGLDGSLSGTLLEGGRLADGRLELRAPAATPLAELLPGLLPGFTADLRGPAAPVLAGLLKAPIWRSAAELQVRAAGTADALALVVTGSLGDLRVDAQPTLDLARSGWRWDGPIALRHPGAPRLAVSLGLRDAPDWLGDGSLSLVAQLAAGPGRVALNDFTLTAGGLHASGGLELRLDAPGGPALTGRVSADQLPLPAPASGDPLPVGALAGWQASVKLEAARVLAGPAVVLRKASGTVALAGGTLRLEGLAAQLDGGALALRASLDSTATPPLLALQGRLTGAELAGPLLDQPFDLTAGTLDASLTLASQGFSPGALLAGATGALAVTVRGGALTGIDLPALVTALSQPAGPVVAGAPSEPAVRAALAGGSMGFDRLEVAASLAHGVVRLDQARLAAPSGNIAISGSVALPGWGLDVRLALHPMLPAAVALPPTVGLRLTGKLDAPQRAPELADLIRWRADSGP